MKIIILIATLLITSCQSQKTNTNEVKIASFEKVFKNNQEKIIEKKYNIEISHIKLNYDKSFIKQIKKFKPSIVIAPTYLNRILLDKKIGGHFLEHQTEINDITNSVKKLKSLILNPNQQERVLPLYLSEIKLFSNNDKLVKKNSISLKELFKHKKINIVFEQNPRIISWVASCLQFKSFLKPSIIANPDKKDLELHLEKFLKNKNISFKSKDDILKKWQDIDVFIGSNWIQNQLLDQKYYKNSIKIKNANLIQLYSLIKTNYANDHADLVVNWIKQNYKDTIFASHFNPITNRESQNQYNIINSNFRKDMLLAQEENYFYFTDDTYDNDLVLKIIDKKFL